MPHVINVTVRAKMATANEGAVYVCGNSDYVVRFDFDAEWAEYGTKTARFVYGSKHQDVVFDGNECPVPIISNAYGLNIGVFAGNLHTTTRAYVPTVRSILCGSGSPDDPPPDVYNQIMAKLNMLSYDIGAAVAEYLKENPITGAGLPEITPESEGKYLRVKDNEATWCELEIPQQYGLVTYDQSRTITIT